MKPATELPWRMSCGAVETESGIPIALMDREWGNGTMPTERDTNCAYIVHAANLYPELVAALRRCQDAMGSHGPCTNNDCRDCGKAWETLNAVLAKCEGGAK